MRSRAPLVMLLAVGTACGGGAVVAPAVVAPEILSVTTPLPSAGGSSVVVSGTAFPGAAGDAVEVRFVAATPLAPCVPSSWTVTGTLHSATQVEATSPATGLLADVPAHVELVFGDGTVAATVAPATTLSGSPDPSVDQDGDAVPDACDDDTYDFRGLAVGARPGGVEAVGAATSTLAGAASGGVAYGAGAFSGVQDRLVRARADDGAQDVDVYLDVDPAPGGWADIELASEGSWADYAGWGVIVQVDAGGLLRLYERQWRTILHSVVGPPIPPSGRLRLRWRKGPATTSVLTVDAWDGGAWDPGLVTYEVSDDTLRRGTDVSLANYHANTRAVRRVSVVRVAPDADLSLRDDAAHSSDWQVFQRGADGTATIPLVFWHRLPEGGRAQARVVVTATGLPLPGHDFPDHETALSAAPQGGRATLRVAGVPAGGKYDVELRLLGPDGAPVAQVARRDVAVGDVWLAAGQSNMSGFSGSLLGGESPTPLAHLFGNDGRWRQAREPMDDPTNATDPVSSEQPLHSPMLAFANAVAAATGVPVGVVPASLGGTNLYLHWARSTTWPASRATLYGSALHRTRVAAGGVAPGGVLWFQGESDAILGRTTAQYRADLEALVGHLRGDLAAPTLPFLCGQLGTFASATLSSWLAVQEAQRQAAVADPRVGLVTAVDLPRADAIHFSVAGYRTLGRRFAGAALRVAYGQPGDAPSELGAAAAGPDGSTVVLSYDGPVSRGSAALYAVADGAGAPTITSAVAAGTTVTLSLDRALSGAATVTYGLSTSPTAPWVLGGDGAPVACFRNVPVAP